MCFLFSFEFCAVSVPRWEREQCLSEINTTQGERGGRQTNIKKESERERQKGGRDRGKTEQINTKVIFEKRESESERNLLKAAENHQRDRGNEEWREGVEGL